jgi:hypothetical protein
MDEMANFGAGFCGLECEAIISGLELNIDQKGKVGLDASGFTLNITFYLQYPL